MNDKKWVFVSLIMGVLLFIGVSCFAASAPNSLPNEYNYETMAEFA